MNEMEYWKSLEKVPSWALKKITGGRLRGMSDINPCWRLQAMTEAFGPCGIGWKYTVEKIWKEPGPEGQVMVFVMVHLFIKNNDSWSEPIPGIGGADLVSKESRGLFGNNESEKCSLTDALSVAMKALGVGAKVYQGLWDGSKYLNPAPQNTEEGIPPPPPPGPKGPKSEAFVSILAALKSLNTYQDVCQFMPKAKKELMEAEYALLKGNAMGLLKTIDQSNLSEWRQYLTDLNAAVAPDECDNLRSVILKLSPKVQTELAKEFATKFPGLFGRTTQRMDI